jgi:hypothetical protein
MENSKKCPVNPRKLKSPKCKIDRSDQNTARYNTPERIQTCKQKPRGKKPSIQT